MFHVCSCCSVSKMESEHAINGVPATEDDHVNSHADHSERYKEFTLLQTVLRDVGLPATIDRTMTSHGPSNSHVTIVLLADLETALPTFLEGRIHALILFIYLSITFCCSCLGLFVTWYFVYCFVPVLYPEVSPVKIYWAD